MPYKFLPGDTVRHIGTTDNCKVLRPNENGERYLLAASDGVAPQTWASEDELEIVKRASDDFEGLGPVLYVT